MVNVVTTRSLFSGNTLLDVKTLCTATTCATTSSLTPTLKDRKSLREPFTLTISNLLSLIPSMELNTTSALLLATSVENLLSLNALMLRDQLAQSLFLLLAFPHRSPIARFNSTGSTVKTTAVPSLNTKFTSWTELT
jgi:hypothetical protein